MKLDYKETIKSWRWRIQRAGFNQTSFAKHVGISAPMLSRYISGEQNIFMETFTEIENALRELENDT